MDGFNGGDGGFSPLACGAEEEAGGIAVEDGGLDGVGREVERGGCEGGGVRRPRRRPGGLSHLGLSEWELGPGTSGRLHKGGSACGQVRRVWCWDGFGLVLWSGFRSGRSFNGTGRGFALGIDVEGDIRDLGLVRGWLGLADPEEGLVDGLAGANERIPLVVKEFGELGGVDELAIRNGGASEFEDFEVVAGASRGGAGCRCCATRRRRCD